MAIAAFFVLSGQQQRATASATPPGAPKMTPEPVVMPNGMSTASSSRLAKSMPLSLIMLMSSIVVSTASTSGLPLWVNSSRFASPFFAVQGMTATWYTSRPSLFFS